MHINAGEIPKTNPYISIVWSPQNGVPKNLMIRLFVGNSMRSQEDKRLREFAKLAFQLFRGFPEFGGRSVAKIGVTQPFLSMSKMEVWFIPPLKKSKCEKKFVVFVILIIVLVRLYFINTFSVLYFLMLGLTSRVPMFSGNP